MEVVWVVGVVGLWVEGVELYEVVGFDFYLVVVEMIDGFVF